MNIDLMSEEEKSYLISKDELLSGVINPLVKEQVGEETPVDMQECARTKRYLELADEQKWLDLRSETEDELAVSAEDSTSRVWWLYSQLQLGEVPLSILSGSIDEVTERIIDDEQADLELRSRAAKLLELAGEQLAEEKQYELSAHFLKRAEKVLPSISRKTENVREKEISDLKELPEYTLTESEKNKILNPTPVPKREVQSTSRTWLIFLALLLCATPAVAYFYGRDLPFGAKMSALLFEPVDKIVPSLRRSLSARKLILPPLEREDGTALDALKYEMDNIFKDSASSEQQIVTQNTKQQDAVDSPVTEKVNGEPSQVALEQVGTSKEGIDLSGPVEPLDFPTQTQPSTSEVSEGLKENSPLVVRKDFARQFPGRTRTDRSGDSSYPKRYEVIAKSEVRASPSYHAAVLKELRIKDRVEVVREERPWSVVRSRKGNIGYVLTQDLTPIEED